MNKKSDKLTELKAVCKKVYINHLRHCVINKKTIITIPIHTARLLKMAGDDVEIVGNGGLTTVEAIAYNGKKFVGVARCNILDNFNKKKARDIAVSRVFNSIEKFKIGI